MGISLKKILTKTTIKVDINFLESLYDKVMKKASLNFVPPLFDEFVISLMSDNIGIAYYYIKWFSATMAKISVFLNTNGNVVFEKCKLLYEITYEYDSTVCDYWVDKVYDNLNNQELDEVEYKSNKFILQVVISSLNLINNVSYYMQHYSPEIEYKVIKATQLKKVENFKNGNGGYEQKIVLKSKVKKYILDENKHKENLKSIRTYRKIKPYWYVRGYYQHFGKEKVLKYIPPRINYRDKKDVTKELDGKEPNAQTYIIK